jgi:hypothetical protein
LHGWLSSPKIPTGEDMSKYLLSLSLLGVLFTGACASGPAVSADGLTLKRVVIYRNGVAYFEREGRVSDSRVSFQVRGDEVGDFLASFAVIERGGSSVKSASFPLKRIDPGLPPRHDGDCKSVPVDPKRRMETVVMELDGREHDLAVGYITEAPIWRPSYRLVLEKGQAHLQLWGIVQNQSGEDWRNTRLTLVADAPLALTTQLETPIIPARPVLTEGEGVIAVVPQGETSLAEEPAPPPAPAMAAHAPKVLESKKEKPMSRSRRISKSQPAAPPSEADEVVMGEVSTGAFLSQQESGPSRTRNLSALAAVAIAGGATRYELPNPVTVPDNSATMLLLADKDVPGESTYLFAPDPGVPQSASHPVRVARFTNKTGGLLERGPLAFFGEGGFLGQGVIDPLPDGASATVPFGLETGLAVEQRVEQIQEGARLFKVEMGTLIIQRQVGPRTFYKIKSGIDRPEKMYLKHARRHGSKLVNPPAGTEDNVGTGSALIPAQISARGTTELFVDEREGRQQSEWWLNSLAEEAVNGYLVSANGTGEAALALKAAWSIRKDWKQFADEAERLRAEQNNLQTSTEETRRNLKAIEKNRSANDLRETLTTRLAKDSSRLDEVTKRLISRDMQVKEQELRFREAIQAIRIPPQP